MIIEHTTIRSAAIETIDTIHMQSVSKPTQTSIRIKAYTHLPDVSHKVVRREGVLWNMSQKR